LVAESGGTAPGLTRVEPIEEVRLMVEDSDRDVDEDTEDDGVLDMADSLLSDDLNADVLDTGVDAATSYVAATRFGTTAAEAQTGPSLSQMLAEEEPDVADDQQWTDEDVPSTDDEVQQLRAGRLAFPDDDEFGDSDGDAFAVDVGIDGGGASAEEAAVHLTDPPDFS
jgi:Family of unknown function (DUF5709)